MHKLLPGLILSAVCLLAQSTTSRVVGTVIDSSGAPVPQAAVKLINEGTQAAFNTETGAAGTYVFDSVQVGNYTLEVNAPGFKKFTSLHNTLTLVPPTTVNPKPEHGAITQP